MILAAIHQFESIQKLKKAGVDAIIVGLNGVSIRSSVTLTRSELKVWKKTCKELDIKIYVNILKLFMEDEMDLVHDCLSYCKDLDIDGIYFADEGVLFEACQMKMQDRLVYQPETLITNHYDAGFYLNQGIQSVSLAHELSLDEIRGIAQIQPVEVLISGYFSILYSKRPLVTNYLAAVHEADIDGIGHRFDLIEQTRQDRMPIVQDEDGTNIYSERPIHSFRVIDQLKQMGIHRFRIDSIFMDDDWTIRQLTAYHQHALLDSGSDHWYYQETIRKKEEQQ